jgi:tRNA(Ile)-lysidine synthase
LTAVSQRSIPLHRSALYREVVANWDGRLAIACSGGGDSSALVVLAGEAARRSKIPLPVVVHVDHRVRPESAREADIVAATARSRGLPFVRATVASPQATPIRMNEAELRLLRYEALLRMVTALGMDGVATAHTRDDQIETILMRLLTGSGGTASAGMRASWQLQLPGGTLKVVRPLLRVSREDLWRIVVDADITIVDDPSNVDLDVRRNRIRHRVIPELRAVFPGFEQPLQRAVELARVDGEFADEYVRTCVNLHAEVEGDRVLIERTFLRSAHPAVAGRVVQWAVRQLGLDDEREVTAERIDAVRRAARGRTGAVIQLPYQVVATIEREHVVLQASRDHDATARGGELA